MLTVTGADGACPNASCALALLSGCKKNVNWRQCRIGIGISSISCIYTSRTTILGLVSECISATERVLFDFFLIKTLKKNKTRTSPSRCETYQETAVTALVKTKYIYGLATRFYRYCIFFLAYQDDEDDKKKSRKSRCDSASYLPLR